MTRPPDDERDRVNPFAPPLVETSTSSGRTLRKRKPARAAGLNAVLGMSGILSVFGFFGFSGAVLLEFVGLGLADVLVSALGLGLTIATWRGSVTGYVGLLVQLCIAAALASAAGFSGTANTDFLLLKALLLFAVFASLLTFHRRFFSQREKASDR